MKFYIQESKCPTLAPRVKHSSNPSFGPSLSAVLPTPNWCGVNWGLQIEQVSFTKFKILNSLINLNGFDFSHIFLHYESTQKMDVKD
jgi:hypothetical protein